MKSNPTNITSSGASKKLVPEFRFPEFVNDDEWISTSLGNKCIYVSSGKNKEKKEKGEFPVYGSTGVIGYSGSFVYDFPAILVARVGANAGQINKVTGKYDVTDNTIIIQLNDDCNLDYVYYFLASRNINIFVFGSGQPLITSSLLKKLILSLPSLSEQKRIAQCLSSLDELIAATKEKVVLLKEHKRGLLQKLFPAKGKTLPELRFPEFKDEGEWKMIRFGSLIDESNEVSKREDEDILLSSTINGIILHSELFSHQRGSSNVGYRKLKKNMLVLSAQNLHLGNANVNTRFEHGLISPAYKIFNILNCDVLFLSQWIKKDTTNQFFYDATTAGASACRRNVVWDDLYNQRILLPSIVEQQKIASVLSSLDNQIEQYNEKVKALESHKKGLMQNLFPKK